MKTKKSKRNNGFTLVELMTTLVLTMIIVMTVGSVILHSRRSFLNAYGKANSNIVTDAYAARNVFDVIVRKATATDIIIAKSGKSAFFEYYNSDASTFPDRYTSFYLSGSDFMAEHGSLDIDGNQTVLETTTISSVADSCMFLNNGSSVSMILNLDDSDKEKVVVSTAYAHN